MPGICWRRRRHKRQPKAGLAALRVTARQRRCVAPSALPLCLALWPPMLLLLLMGCLPFQLQLQLHQPRGLSCCWQAASAQTALPSALAATATTTTRMTMTALTAAPPAVPSPSSAAAAAACSPLRTTAAACATQPPSAGLPAWLWDWASPPLHPLGLLWVVLVLGPASTSSGCCFWGQVQALPMLARADCSLALAALLSMQLQGAAGMAHSAAALAVVSRSP